MKRFLLSNISIKIGIGFFLALIAIIIVQYLTDNSIENLKTSQQEMLRSNYLTSKVSLIESSVYAYDNKISDFVCTGNSYFLKNNEVNLKQAIVNMQFLLDQNLSGDQKILVIKLDSLVKMEINAAQQTLADYHNESKSDAIAQVSSGIGERILDDISYVVSSFQRMESENLSRIIERRNQHTREVEMMNNMATGFAIVVIVISIMVLFRDIKRRNKVELELRNAEKQAYKVAEMKEQFMANMSHEIRTPMNSILGFANFLSHTELNKDQQDYIRAIQASGENLLTIINDILDFSKIEAGMLHIEKVAFNPAELFHSLQVMFQQRADEKNLSLNFNVDDIPVTLIGDPTRLTQILVNLINNAIKFTKQGGVSVTVRKLTENDDEIFLDFQVKDSGIGIPHEKLDAIFDRFNQADTDTTRKFGGSGLGLSIVKKLIELLNGKIKVESNVGIGTVFIFQLPFKKNSVAFKENLSDNKIESPKPATSAAVLVVEDNIMNQKLAQSLLQYWGFKFEIAENGNVAIEKLKVKSFDLILMDIQMPELNGYDTAFFIRNNLKLDTPIIAMTAHALQGERDKCIRYGMNDYISKPIHEKELLKLIEKYLNIGQPELSSNQNHYKSSQSNNKITNLQYLNDLSNGKPEFVRQMVDLFILEAPEEIAKLEQAINQMQYEDIYSIAHKFKSTAYFVGIDSAKSDLITIERCASEKSNPELIRSCFIKVKDVCNRAVDELKSL
ncbi:MAG: multi-sensor hybrid histidine kinase [Bacteroidetes bacterium OLB10]|nr:MAG: multi-sensor hybrid histidine kinase [Bacteroidetes bacterium OLB10]